MSILLMGYIKIIHASGFGGFYFLEQCYGGAAFALVLDLGKRTWSQWRGEKKAEPPQRMPSQEHDVTEPLLEMTNLQDTDHDEQYHRSSSHRKRHMNTFSSQLWALELLFCIIPVWVLVLPLVLIVCAGLGQTLSDGSAAIVGKFSNMDL
jgi:hypothetical protein